MLKNVPILAFDQDQKIWSLEFSDHGIDPETKKSKNESKPDKLTRFLQEYWSSKKSASSFSFDRNRCLTGADKHKNAIQLKLPIRQKELAKRNDKIQQDNLFTFLKEHMENSINQEVNLAKTNANVLVNLHGKSV